MTAPVNGDFGAIRHPYLTIVPTLYPVRLPYKAQHVVLFEVQTLLEECFYDFARKWLPALLEEQKCDCALAIELTEWSHLIREDAGKVSTISESPFKPIHSHTHRPLLIQSEMR